jgi:hypothetical protein
MTGVCLLAINTFILLPDIKHNARSESEIYTPVVEHYFRVKGRNHFIVYTLQALSYLLFQAAL